MTPAARAATMAWTPTHIPAPAIPPSAPAAPGR